MAKVICDGCPCVNNGDEGTTCNVGYALAVSRRSDIFYEADDCELESVRWSVGEFRPTLRAVDPPLALPSADDNQKSAGN